MVLLAFCLMHICFFAGPFSKLLQLISPLFQLLAFGILHSTCEMVNIKLYPKSNFKHRSSREVCSHDLAANPLFFVIRQHHSQIIILAWIFSISRTRWHPIYINQIVKKMAQKASCERDIFEVLQRNSRRNPTEQEGSSFCMHGQINNAT